MRIGRGGGGGGGRRESRGTVVLLHGLGRTPRAMWPISLAARHQGYEVLNLGYRSRRGNIAAHAEAVADRLARVDPDGERGWYFVTHSLGGIVLRHAVAVGLLDAARIRRVVMLSPPNQGSEVARFVCEHRIAGPVSRRLLGPSGPELAAGDGGIVRQLPPVSFETGVIAGTRHANPFFQNVLRDDNDGTVSVSDTMVPGMSDHLVVRHGHTFIMAAPDVIRQVFTFLDTGRFAR